MHFPFPTIIASLTRSVSDEDIVDTSSQYSCPLHDDQEYIRVNKLDYLRLMWKVSYLCSGLRAPKHPIQDNDDETHSFLDDSADDYLYELLQSLSRDSDEVYQEIDSTPLRDQIYNYARTYGFEAATSEDAQRPIRKAVSFDVKLPPEGAFRTVSHFGFLTPKANRKPVDYHMPSYKSLYQPLSRELSIEELFTNHKYVALPDESIRLIFKNKLASFNELKKSTARELKFRRDEDKENPFKKFYGAEDRNEFVDSAAIIYRSCPDLLMRLMRNVDNRNATNNKDVYATPFAHSEYSDYGTQSENERLLRHQSECETATQRPGDEPNRKVSRYNITLKVNNNRQNALTERNTQIHDMISANAYAGILEDVTNKRRLSTSLPLEREKKLLSRSVRNERKKEFTEIWMNHLKQRKVPDENDDRTSPYADMDLDPMEEEIMAKIDENHLDKDDESIFTKIKSVIIERSISKKKASSKDGDSENLDVSSSFSTSTPKGRRSLQFGGGTTTTSPESSIVSNQTYHIDNDEVENVVSELMIHVNPIDVKAPKSATKNRKAKRNFIVENIRNASQRKRTPKTPKSTKPAIRSQSAPRLHIDDLRQRHHNAIFEPRPFASESDVPAGPVSTSIESTDGDSCSLDVEAVCQNFLDLCDSSNRGEMEKLDQLSESVAELKSTVERCEEQMDNLFLEKMEKEIDEIFNLHAELNDEYAEHKEKFEQKILEDTERLQQLDSDRNSVQSH